MKGKRNLIIGIILGALVILTFVYFYWLSILNNISFFLGFIACLVLVSLSLILLFIWNKNSLLISLLGKRSKTKESKNAARTHTIIWILVSVFIVLGGLVTSFLIFKQNELLKTQTQNQNKKIAQQSELLESIRTSNLEVLMGNILDEIDDELKNNPKRTLSAETIARIAALSYSFKPYGYSDEDSLTENKFSPERGQLLLALSKLNIDSSSFDEIKSKVTFSGADLSGADLRKVNFRGADLSWANLNEADLREANLNRADLRGAILWGANLRKANLKGTDLKRADLRWADLNGAVLKKADLNGADLTSAKLKKADLRGADLKWADLSGAFLNEANLAGVNLLWTVLRRANLSNANFSETNLRMTNLSEADLSGANLWGANLRKANLRGADLNGTDLNWADLTGANLTGANLTGADLKWADLSGAFLNEANLTGVDLLGAALKRTNLSKANLTEANLSRANLSEAKMSGIELTRSTVEEENWLEKLNEWRVKGAKEVKARYKIVDDITGKSNYRLEKIDD